MNDVKSVFHRTLSFKLAILTSKYNSRVSFDVHFVMGFHMSTSCSQ